MRARKQKVKHVKMDEDLFELEYADELDALEDIELETTPAPKSRKSLQFSTPSSKNKGKENGVPGQDDLNSSFLSMPPSQSPKKSLNDTIQSEHEDDLIENGLMDIPGGDDGGIRQQNKKRSAWETDLLDTAADDFFDSLPDLEPQSKRARSSQPDNEEEDIIITNLRQSRERSHARRRNNAPESVDDYQLRLVEGYDLERQRVLRSIPHGDYVSATDSDGQRVYMKLIDQQTLDDQIDGVSRHVRQAALLTVPISVMKEQVEDERRQQVLREAEELSERVRRELADDGDKDVEMEEPNMRPGALWVEKYAPKSYTDLLSEEAINRTLLHWLKQWDYVVFGKDLPVIKNKKKGKEAQNNNKWKKFQPEVSTELDSYNRPVQKVVLLCGPPGLGKTTLAHVVAAHAGYNVVEMNASDDRSVDVFRNKIEAATQMRAVMGADPRPNCLVIDEIDGAPQPAVNVLLNILKRPEGGGGNKKKKEGDMLLRPVICICNDQYAPALRQLRQQALVLTFPPTEPSRLASRLSEVVRRERLKADLNTLLALCERTDNDIRSCLNTLQFIQQKQAELTLRSVQTMSVGQKDAHKSLFSVWREIFTMPRPKRNRFVSIQDIMEGKADSLHLNSASPTARFQRILNLAQATGEYERVSQGLFENYLEAKSKDPHLVGLNLATEWLCFVDSLNQYTSHTQDYSVMKYVPFLHVTFHLLYASYVPPRISFPHVQFEVQQTQTRITNLLVSLLADMTPAVRKFVNIRNLTLDLLPPLMDILQPTLRPVNTQLYSNREKEDLAHLVHIMINYNMTYRQERTPEGQYTYVLDPNVEEVVRFTGTKQRKQLTYGAKQLIAREIELEKLRRNEAASVSSESVSSSQKSSVLVPNHKQTLEAKPVVEDKPRVNYFAGFTRTKREKQNVQKDDEKEKQKEEKNVLDTAIWFHFKEGYSNAVRRNVRVQDLL